jgi:hypothetical protein
MQNICYFTGVKQMFNIGGMRLGEIIAGILAERGMKEAALVSRMHQLMPDVPYTRLQVSLNTTIQRNSNTSKYLDLIAKALELTVDEVLNWKKDGFKGVKSPVAPYTAGNWPFGDLITPTQYHSLDDEQKHFIVCRIITFIDDNNLKKRNDNK